MLAVSITHPLRKGIAMSHSVLITGASRGIGLEFARQYAEAGWRVHACCRDPQKAGKLQQVADKYTDLVTLHTLDVGDSGQIKRLVNALSDEAIDLLINNAGIYLPDYENGQISERTLIESFRINSIAPLIIAEAFADNLDKGSHKKIVNITSKMGSIDDNTSGGRYAYRSSKAALNMVTKSLAVDLAPRGISAIVLHPGWVQTDMGGSNASTSVEKSVTGMRAVIERIKLKDSGKFYGYDGKEIPW